jgi:hypothetical protein
VDLIYLVRDRNRCWAFVNAVINLGFRERRRIFLLAERLSASQKKILLHVILAFSVINLQTDTEHMSVMKLHVYWKQYGPVFRIFNRQIRFNFPSEFSVQNFSIFALVTKPPVTNNSWHLACCVVCWECVIQCDDLWTTSKERFAGCSVLYRSKYLSSTLTHKYVCIYVCMWEPALCCPRYFCKL